MKVSIFIGDISDAPAEALCTSTNPRLSLVMGTGASVRGRGGFEILRQCQAFIVAEAKRTGRPGLPPGSVHTTTAGQLPAKIAVHCVASDGGHHSSPAIIRSCVAGALAAADAAGCTSIAMPLFGTGHARFNGEQSISTIAEMLRDAPTRIDHVIIVVTDSEQASIAARVLRYFLPECEVVLANRPSPARERRATWPSRWGDSDEF